MYDVERDLSWTDTVNVCLFVLALCVLALCALCASCLTDTVNISMCFV